MKNFKISLLAAGATIALLACSSLEVSNPDAENFPPDWSTSEFVRVNPDLRALQIRDQVDIINTRSGKPSDMESFLSDSVMLKKIALEHAGFTESNYSLTDNNLNYLKSFNINGVEHEDVVFDTLTLDSVVFKLQYTAFGKIEGRPYRACGDADMAKIVKRGPCQASSNTKVGYRDHLYCALEGAAYCLDCDKIMDDCPVASSSSNATPKSSETNSEGDSSSSVAAEGDSSSSEAVEPESSVAAEPESSAGEGAEPESSSATEPAAESSSSVTE